MSLADLQPTVRKAVYRLSENSQKLVEARGFTHPEVKGLFLHVLEEPFDPTPHHLCSVVHIESALAVATAFSFHECYEIMMRLKHLDWQRTGKELAKDKELAREREEILKDYIFEIDALEGVL